MNATREFTNELGNRIKITIEGPTSTSENILTAREFAELREAIASQEAENVSDEDRIAYWKGAYERMAARNIKMERALRDAAECLDGEPEYHYSGMGCGLEDRGITDRYEAMRHGWDCAMERVDSEHLIPARDILLAAATPPTA